MRELYVCFKMLKKAEGRVRKGRDLFPVHLLIGTGCRWKAPAELWLGALKKSISDVLSLLLGSDPGGLSTCKWWWPAERLWVVSTFQDLVPSSTNRCTSLHLGKKSICWFLFIYLLPFGIKYIWCKCGGWGRHLYLKRYKYLRVAVCSSEGNSRNDPLNGMGAFLRFGLSSLYVKQTICLIDVWIQIRAALPPCVLRGRLCVRRKAIRERNIFGVWSPV